MVYVFLANGFEEMEAIAPIDLLRRAELKVVTVAVGTDTTTVTGAHDIRIHADITEQQVDFTGIEMVVLPGGMPGTLHLEQSAVVQTVLKHCKQQNPASHAVSWSAEHLHTEYSHPDPLF